MITNRAHTRVRRACARMAVAACVTAVPLVALAGSASASVPSDISVANASFSTGLCDPHPAAQNHCTDSESPGLVDRADENQAPPVEYPRYSAYGSYGAYPYADYEYYGDHDNGRSGHAQSYGGDPSAPAATSVW